MKCTNCGQENDDDAKFCEHCGSRLSSPTVDQKPPVKPVKEGWSTSSKVIVIGLVILIIILGVTLGVLLKSNNPTTTNTTPTISMSTGIPLAEVPALAQTINQNGVDFTTINFGGVTLDQNQCLYITARAIVMINNGETGNIPINQYGDPDDPYGTITSATIAKSDYVNMAQRTYQWMDNNGDAPNYGGIYTAGQPDLSTYNMLKLYSKILTEYKNTGQLPAAITIP
ncbi:zinc-ribbon domain-containing protein [Methanobacterium sp. CWC-01]|uniref:zinc ribbon domain-containing protein n=1 Tax=Methanobacterium aridiramus TaxID=2584467 RepID=UPI0025756AD8|nr:zinc ribbon domain-containing protein [Methanobacterium sp. CWC-01]WJI10447.1 zinc-ribbon domain-containing protein [Methanobacterium sp. CWC-01]